MPKTIPLGDATLTFHCTACDQDVSMVVDSDTDLATCGYCGANFGTYSDVKAKAMDQAAAVMKSKFKTAFRRR